jgi:hypothetical protein
MSSMKRLIWLNYSGVGRVSQRANTSMYADRSGFERDPGCDIAQPIQPLHPDFGVI